MQIIATNKKANHDYLIKDKYEAALVLNGSEVKSLRVNTGSIKESHIYEKKGELWLSNCFIKKYSSSNSEQHETTRIKKILVNKREFNKIVCLSKKDGKTIIPLILYFNDKGLAKLSIGLGKGLKKYDKRAIIKSKEWKNKKEKLLKK